MNPSNPRGIRVPFMGRGARPTEHRHVSTAAAPCPQEYFDRRCLVGSVDDSFVLLFRKYAGWIRRRFFSRLGFVSSSLTPPAPDALCSRCVDRWSLVVDHSPAPVSSTQSRVSPSVLGAARRECSFCRLRAPESKGHRAGPPVRNGQMIGMGTSRTSRKRKP